MRMAQEIDENIEGGGREGRLAGQAEGLDMGVVAIDVVTMMVVSAEIWVFRWIVLRMPVLREAHELPSREPEKPVHPPIAASF